MQKALYLMLASAVLLPAGSDQPKAPPTAQIQRGQELFLNSPKGVACKTCHQFAGVGTAIGPNLTTMASYASLHSLVMTMHMKMTDHVMRVKTTVASFPGVIKEQTSSKLEVYDLGQIPPVLRTFTASQIVSIDRDEKWKHPPAMANYTQQELADIISFLRWAATGTNAEVFATDIDPAW